MDPEEWRPNVQTYNGSSAISAVLTAFLKPGDVFLTLSTDDGGFTSHQKPEVNGNKYFRCVNFHLNDRTGELDYENIKVLAEQRYKNLVTG